MKKIFVKTGMTIIFFVFALFLFVVPVFAYSASFSIPPGDVFKEGSQIFVWSKDYNRTLAFPQTMYGVDIDKNYVWGTWKVNASFSGVNSFFWHIPVKDIEIRNGYTIDITGTLEMLGLPAADNFLVELTFTNEERVYLSSGKPANNSEFTYNVSWTNKSNEFKYLKDITLTHVYVHGFSANEITMIYQLDDIAINISIKDATNQDVIDNQNKNASEIMNGGPDYSKVDDSFSGDLSNAESNALGGKTEEEIQAGVNSALNNGTDDIDFGKASRISSFFDSCLNVFGGSYSSLLLFSLCMALAAFLIGRRYG